MTVKKCIREYYGKTKLAKRILRELKRRGFDLDEKYGKFDQDLLIKYVITYIQVRK